MNSRVVLALSLIVAATAAGPAKTSVSLGADAQEQKPERQVRSSSETMSMSVEPDGEVMRVQQSEAKPTQVQLDAKPVAAKVQLATEPAAKVQRSEPEPSKTVTNVVKAENVAPKPTIIAAETKVEGESDSSWKSTFIFFSSLVLFVILAAMIVARVYNGYNASSTAAGGPESVSIKAEKASAAEALQQHLNDSSSTSDSGEKIAMLFDRVRRSLEDLSNENESQQADVAGGSQGQGKADKPKATNTL